VLQQQFEDAESAVAGRADQLRADGSHGSPPRSGASRERALPRWDHRGETASVGLASASGQTIVPPGGGILMTADASPGWRLFLGLSNEDLLAQCEMDRFRASGPG